MAGMSNFAKPYTQTPAVQARKHTLCIEHIEHIEPIEPIEPIETIELI